MTVIWDRHIRWNVPVGSTTRQEKEWAPPPERRGPVGGTSMPALMAPVELLVGRLA
jgi:hypothetical protein